MTHDEILNLGQDDDAFFIERLELYRASLSMASTTTSFQNSMRCSRDLCTPLMGMVNRRCSNDETSNEMGGDWKSDLDSHALTQSSIVRDSNFGSGFLLLPKAAIISH